ncbi:hypothetical protein V8C86DRAFT_2598778 [Haematococcus lacustris]
MLVGWQSSMPVRCSHALHQQHARSSPRCCSHYDRRYAHLAVVGGCISTALPVTAATLAPQLPPFLQAPSPGSLLQASPSQQLISNPGNSWAFTDAGRQLYYPSWLEGTWAVSASFQGAGFPLGSRFISKAVPGVTKGSMLMAMADVGAAQDVNCLWHIRFLRTPLGVVADRSFNVQQQADALLGYEAVKSVEYEPDVNPTRLAVVWATPRRSEGPASFDMRKAEVFINNRSSDPLNDSPCSWSCSELYRQVSQAARQGSVGDYQVITKFVAASGVDVCDTAAGVEAQMRVAAFLQPQDALYFETGGKAVAVYDYRMQLSRV